MEHEGSSPSMPVLSQMNQVHILPSYFDAHFNIIIITCRLGLPTEEFVLFTDVCLAAGEETTT
jgi:hypothetical protein